MATITREAAEKLAEKGGRFYAVVRYQNRIKIDEGADSYNPDAKNPGFDWAVCSKRRHYQALLSSPFVGGVDILAASKVFYRDEAVKAGEYPEDSDEVSWAEIVAANPQIFAHLLNSEKKSRGSKARKKNSRKSK